MNIQQISLNIDRQVARIEGQITQLRQEPSTEEITKQLKQLEALRYKLVRSKELAWETQGLVGEDERENRKRKRAFGMGLAISSSIGIVILLYLIIAS